MATVKLDPAKGIQIPNLTTTERNAISSPETGAIIWNTTTSEINQYNGSAWEITYTPVAGITSSADATAITIDSSENVGIGKTDPTAKLETSVTDTDSSPVNGTNIYKARSSHSLQISNVSDSATYSGIHLRTRNTGASAWSINNVHTSQYVGDLTFVTRTDTSSAAERMRIQSDGSLLVGTTDGGSSGVGDIVANAIFLGGNQAANELDDYEEGTHTVTATCSTSGSVTLSSTNNKFTYTKIGNLVTITGRLDVSAISSPNGDLSFSLPFAIAQTGSSQNQSTAGAIFVWYPTSGDSGKWVAWADGGESVVYVRHGDGVQPPQSANLVRVSTEFRLNFSYTTA